MHGMKEVGTYQGKLVIECERPLSRKQMDQLRAKLDSAFPEGAVILDAGLRVSRSEQLDRIEAKLDWLIEALSGDEEGDEAPPTLEVRSLDGSVTRLPVGDDGGFL